MHSLVHSRLPDAVLVCQVRLSQSVCQPLQCDGKFLGSRNRRPEASGLLLNFFFALLKQPVECGVINTECWDVLGVENFGRISPVRQPAPIPQDLPFPKSRLRLLSCVRTPKSSVNGKRAIKLIKSKNFPSRKPLSLGNQAIEHQPRRAFRFFSPPLSWRQVRIYFGILTKL